MKILSIIGSPRIGRTYKLTQRFEQKFAAFPDISFEYIHLKEFNILPCKGCEVCLKQGEVFCPHKDKDDLPYILKKMHAADGIIFATPNYALHVTALMKNFLDRLAYIFHRPCFFHKASTALVTQGVYGDKEMLKYFYTLGRFWGFHVCEGVGLTTPSNNLLPSELKKIDDQLSAAAKRFYKTMLDAKSPSPDYSMLWIFRFVRTFYANNTNKAFRDYEYFKENGWFESNYYYDVKLNILKKSFAALADAYAKKLTKKTLKEQEKFNTSQDQSFPLD